MGGQLKDEDLLRFLGLRENVQMDEKLSLIWGSQGQNPFVVQAVGNGLYRLLCDKVQLVARKFGEMYLVLYRLFSHGGMHVCVPVDRKEVYRLGVDEEWILRQALKNTRNLFPPRLYMTEWIGKVDRLSQGIFMTEENPPSTSYKNVLDVWGRRGFRLTNTRWEGGAIAAFYPGVLLRLYELFDEEYYVAFLGNYEARIHPKSIVSAMQIKEGLERWNATNMEDGTRVLSYCVYSFHHEWGVLQPVEGQ